MEGRECTDFQAFTVAALDKGNERGLDPTTTRTLMGAADPGPGLHAKYFNVDMQPMVELTRDTVGRHDSFNLACNARYYDDKGYPGHVNCSDNFNKALDPFGVAPGRGWEAMNFYYNTNLDDLTKSIDSITLLFRDPQAKEDVTFHPTFTISCSA